MTRLERYAKKYRVAKQRLKELPATIEKVKEEETEARTRAFLDDAETSIADELQAKREQLQREEIEIRSMLPGIRTGLLDEAARVSAERIRERLLEKPGLEKELHDAETRLHEHLERALRVALRVYGTDRISDLISNMERMLSKRRESGKAEYVQGLKPRLQAFDQRVTSQNTRDRVLQEVMRSSDYEELSEELEKDEEKRWGR